MHRWQYKKKAGCHLVESSHLRQFMNAILIDCQFKITYYDEVPVRIDSHDQHNKNTKCFSKDYILRFNSE